VADYLIKELNKLGLRLRSARVYAERLENLQSKNILARIKGTNTEKVLLLSHYDSAPHPTLKERAMQALE
jgi:acetylornithine deacetylase/succinyl-diaminopimelate desuccinylase-like protein